MLKKYLFSKANLKSIYTVVLVLTCVLSTQSLQAQFLMDMVDTSKDMGKNMLGMYNRFNSIRFSGYIQPQFQITDTNGAKSFEGGDFSTFSNSRFSMRRGRIRTDYVRYSSDNNPLLQFVFQYDISERGVFMRDFWGRLYDNRYKLFSFSVGMFARPFGYEINLGSADRESPERGRMSQILMKIERDLGAMISFEPRKRTNFFQYIKMDIGIFNGPGLGSTTDYDAHKDLIGRLALKPYPITHNLLLSAGTSYYVGGILQNSKYRSTMGNDATLQPIYQIDSIQSKQTIAPRKYIGADAQIKLKHAWGATELRAEIIGGIQSAYVNSSETPTSITADTTIKNMMYVRPFLGGYFYFLQNIFNKKHQLVVKYDFYDPNRKVKGNQIGNPQLNFSATDIMYNTFGIGYNYYYSENLRYLIYFACVNNEKTSLAGYTQNLKDNVFTARIQYRF